MTKILGIGIVAVLIALILGLAIWLSNLGQSNTGKTQILVPTVTTYQSLLSKNPSFAQADQAYKAGNVSQAQILLNTALQSAQTPAQQGQIEFKLATVVENSFKDPTSALAAIPLLKQIAANTSYPAITRASAVQEMAAAFYISGDARYTNEIFKDQPYTALYTASDVSQSYRNLFGYATSLYPLAYSELRIAFWYANQIVPASSNGVAPVTLSPDQVSSYKNIIRQDIASADKDIARIQNDPNQNGIIPALIQREAVVAGKMQITGDDSFGDAETLFKEDLALYASTTPPGSDGFTRYYYAAYLAHRYGKSRAADIENILAPLYTDAPYKGTPSAHEFGTERNNILGDKPNLQLLASIDPKFKTYLISLGWTATDFK